MYMFDGRIPIKDREFLEKYLNGYEYKTSGLSFSALYMWRDINQFSWDMIGDYMCMSGVSHLELEQGIELPFLFPPLTSTGEYDKEKLRETIFLMQRQFSTAGPPLQPAAGSVPSDGDHQGGGAGAEMDGRPPELRLHLPDPGSDRSEGKGLP